MSGSPWAKRWLTMATDRRAELERILSILESEFPDTSSNPREWARKVMGEPTEREKAIPVGGYDRRRYHQEHVGSFEFDFKVDGSGIENAVFRIVDVPNPPEAERVDRREFNERYVKTGRRYRGWMLKIACPSCRGNVDIFFPDEPEHAELRRDMRRQYGGVPAAMEMLMEQIRELRNKLLDAEEDRASMEAEMDDLMESNEKLERDLEEALTALEDEAWMDMDDEEDGEE